MIYIKVNQLTCPACWATAPQRKGENMVCRACGFTGLLVKFLGNTNGDHEVFRPVHTPGDPVKKWEFHIFQTGADGKKWTSDRYLLAYIGRGYFSAEDARNDSERRIRALAEKHGTGSFWFAQVVRDI